VAQDVVARFIDGRIVKGVSLDVDPGRPTCHIKQEGQRQMVEVKLADLKALFFVKTLAGDSGHQEASTLDPGDARARSFSTIAIEFKDGECIVGLTARYPPIRPFFFVVPVDTASNNVRILVNRAAVANLSQPSSGTP
jgi:uncharacterized protein DUF6982